MAPATVVDGGTRPAPVTVTGALPAPLFVSSPITFTPAGTTSGKVSPLPGPSYRPGLARMELPFAALASALVSVLNGAEQVPGFESSPFTASADQSKLQVNDAVTASVVLTVT